MSVKLKSFLINLALLFMIAELSYINSKSLLHLSGNGYFIHQAFAVVGAIAFSLVTIIVMQQSNLRWQKFVFPFFDAILVFLGFNLDYNPDMRIYLTVFMSLFIGCIMYSLGTIEYNKGENKGIKEIDYQKRRANTLGKELETFRRELRKKTSEIEEIKTYCSGLESNKEELQSKLKLAESKLNIMEPIYTKHEVGRIRKKNPANRTESEIKLLQTIK